MVYLDLYKNDYYDFTLTDDSRPFIRDYNNYILFDIDVTKSLTSISGSTQPQCVRLNTIALTGYDNGLLNYNVLPEYYGNVVKETPYNYTFIGDSNNSSYLHNFNSNFGFNGFEPILIQESMPISQNINDTLFMLLYDNNSPYYVYFLFNYVDGKIGGILCENNPSISGITYNPNTLFSYYLINNTTYFQINGVTVSGFTNNYTGTTPDYRFGTGLFSSTNTGYTISDLRIYGHKPNYTGTTNNITGVTTGLTSGSTTGTTDIIYYTTGLTSGGTPTYTVYKTKFTLLPITGFTKNTKYNIYSKNGYNQLDGGFYQGFFKIYHTKPKFTPRRMHKGWTTNMLLHYPITGFTSGVTLNSVNTGNTGFIYYIGTRAQDKYSTLTPTVVKFLNEKYDYSLPTYPIGYISTNNSSFDNYYYELTTEFGDMVFDEDYDVYDVFGELLDEAYNSYEYGYYTGLFSGYTMNITGATVPYANVIYTDQNYKGAFSILSGSTYAGRSVGYNNIKYTGYLNIKNGLMYSGVTYISGGTILTYYDEYKDIIDNAFGIRITPDGRIGYRTIYETDPCYTGTTQAVSGISNNSFVDYSNPCDNFTISKIITKYFTIEESYTRSSIINQFDNTNPKYLFISVTFIRDYTYNTMCQLKYLTYKNGTLSIDINGINIYRNYNVTEPIPHALDNDSLFQQTVPFNISFGGGTQGLYDAMYIDTGTTKQDILGSFFAGTFEGGVKSIQMYSVPLYITEIREIINNLPAYNLYQPIGGRRIYIKTQL